MGQAWCKEKSTKAQDSKSPLDRVFVRCAHRIYPSLKEEGSVLGGATQRVTSSEIGYAGSPPREVLTRGRSIDSVDRPFHPSDWVDVNLEVPSTPRPCSVLTNLTVDTNLYPTTTPTSSCSNLKDATPIPPPRRRKRNKGRPLPPKPDEIVAENLPNGLKRPKSSEEPLYSSVKSPKSSGDEQDAEEETRLDKHRSQEDGVRDGRRPKEIYEHKVNGTGKVISSDVVSGKRTCENVQQQQRKTHENEEYDRFARSRTTKDSSTPNRVDKSRSKEIEKQIKDSSRDAANSSGNARTKNYSTVSLPNYDELDVARYRTKENVDHEHQQEETRKSRRPVRSSTGSLPAESFLSPFSEKTSVRLEDYIPRSDNLSPYQVLEKLDCGANARMAGDDFVKYDPSKSEDWELGDVGNCELNHRRRLSFEDTSKINDERRAHDDKDEDVVDFSTGRGDERRSSLDQDASRSSVHLQKPESFGKTPSPVVGEPEYTEVDPNRTHLKYFNPPTLDKSCGISCVEETSETEEPFFLDEAKHRSALDTIRGSATVHPESDRSDRSKMTFARSLSNESEPNDDAYESKELSSRTAGLIRTISEESLPREMLEEHALDDFFDEKLAKDVHNKLKKSLDEWKTSTPPPPSPEPKIKPQIQDSDHSTLLKVLKEDAAEGSNLSSMTPSLNELEAALSDMLEKEDTQDGPKEDGRTNGGSENFTLRVEPAKVFGSADSFNKNETDDEMETVDHQNLVERELREANEAPVSLTRILNDKKPVAGRKVSFCMWEEAMTEMGVQKDGEVIVDSTDLDKVAVLRKNESRGTGNVVSSTEFPPEKPCRLNRSTDELVGNVSGIPTPPRRRNRSLGAVNNKESEIARNGSAVAELVSNDRLI